MTEAAHRGRRGGPAWASFMLPSGWQAKIAAWSPTLTPPRIDAPFLAMGHEPIFRIRLREMMRRYTEVTGMPMTPAILSQRVGLSPATLDSIALRRRHNPSLQTITRLCIALGCSPGDLLTLDDETGTAKGVERPGG